MEKEISFEEVLQDMERIHPEEPGLYEEEKNKFNALIKFNEWRYQKLMENQERTRERLGRSYEDFQEALIDKTPYAELMQRKKQAIKIKRMQKRAELGKGVNTARRNKANEDALAFGVFGISMLSLFTSFGRSYVEKVLNNLSFFNNLEGVVFDGIATLTLGAGAVYGLYKAGKYLNHVIREKRGKPGANMDMRRFLREQYPDSKFLIDNQYDIV